MAQSPWQRQTDNGNWLFPPFDASNVQASFLGLIPDLHPQHVESRNINLSYYSTFPSNPDPLIEHPPVQRDSPDALLDQQITELLPRVTSATKHCILQLLLQNLTAPQPTSSGPNDISISDPAVHAPVDDQQMALPLDPAIQFYSDADVGIDVNTNSHYPPGSPLNDQVMLSPGFEEYLETLAQDDSSPFADFVKSTKNSDGAHRVTHPSTNVTHSEEYHHLANSKHHSNPPQVPPPMPYLAQDFDPRGQRPLGDFSISSGKSFTCKYPECGTKLNRKGELTRHQRGCKLNPDPIKYTCLLHSGQVQTFRADKIRPHLEKKHGWSHTMLQDVPKAWLWPLVWAGQTQGWACKLCGSAAAPLGIWPADQETFERHIRDCNKGGNARASRYPNGWVSQDAEEMLTVCAKRLSLEEPKLRSKLEAPRDEEDGDGAADDDCRGEYQPYDTKW